MLKQITKIFCQVAVMVTLVTAFAPGLASAALNCAGASGGSNISGCLGSGACLGADAAKCKTADPTTKTNDIIKLVINIFSVVTGFAAVFMIVYAGFKYIVSGGESAAIASAKTTIIYAIVGLIIVVLAQIIVKFVLAKTASAGSVTAVVNIMTSLKPI